MVDLEKIKPKIKKLAEKYNLSLVLLFGSQASGKTHSQSDVDLAFLTAVSMSLKNIAEMQDDFSETLKLEKIEMIALNGAHPFLLKQAAIKGRALYEKESSLFAKFKIYAFKRFMEAKPLLDLRRLSLEKFLQKI